MPTFTTTLLNQGAPLAAVQSLLGHEKTETAQIYARLSGSSRQAANHRYFVGGALRRCRPRSLTVGSWGANAPAPVELREPVAAAFESEEIAAYSSGTRSSPNVAAISSSPPNAFA